MLITAVLSVCIAVGLAQNCEDNEVCYPRAGCFNTCPPFDQLPPPQSPQEIGIEYYIFTRANQNNPELIDENNLGTRFNPTRPTVFVIHGFVGSADGEWNENLKNALLQKEDMNVIQVGWNNGSDPNPDDPFSPYPQSNTRVVGSVTALVASSLRDNAGMIPARAHCTGFSLGGHACGFFGKSFSGLGRISGMDPAGPGFDTMTMTTGHLWNTDATYVDIIHSNGWDYLANSGSQRQAGDVDFWPNKGGTQPGCEFGVCAHYRGPELFIESINSACAFTSRQCGSVQDMREDRCDASCSGNDCQYMGYNSVNYPGRGNFVLSTNGASPYCQN